MSRLLPFLPAWVDLDQVGFIPGKEARGNTTKALNILHWMKSKGQEGFSFLLSLDSEKALDRVAWHYLRATLSHLGIPTPMLQWIMLLYTTPTASIRLTGQLSDAFQN